MTMPTLFKAIKDHAKPIARDIYAALHETETCIKLLPESPEKDAVKVAMKALHNRLAGYAKDALGLTIAESDDADITLFSGGAGDKD